MPAFPRTRSWSPSAVAPCAVVQGALVEYADDPKGKKVEGPSGREQSARINLHFAQIKAAALPGDN
ncbi:MAG: hypothetical protein IIB03_01385 [Acidobacteria bacterium]|nr:hypothetical protein [Acidobacteriota bacterium]